MASLVRPPGVGGVVGGAGVAVAAQQQQQQQKHQETRGSRVARLAGEWAVGDAEVAMELARRLRAGLGREREREDHGPGGVSATRRAIGRALAPEREASAVEAFADVAAVDVGVANAASRVLLAVRPQPQPPHRGTTASRPALPPQHHHHEQQPTQRPAEIATQLLRDFAFALQGVDGHFGGKRIARVPTAHEADALRRAAEVGRMYALVRARAGELMAAPAELGLVTRWLGHAIEEELAGYDAFVSQVVDAAEAASSSARPNAAPSLLEAVAWAASAMRRMRVLWEVCESTRGARGGALLSMLHAHATRGDPLARATAGRLLRASFAPILDMTMRFLDTGDVRDPHAEFFVAGARRGARLDPSMVPTFVSRALAERVLSVGASVELVRMHGDSNAVAELARVVEQDRLVAEVAWEDLAAAAASSSSSLSSEDDDVGSRFARKISRAADVRATLANELALRTLRETHRLDEHLLMLKRVMALGHGDFAQSLAVHCAPVLGRASSKISRVDLESAVEQALRESLVLSTNASAMGGDHEAEAWMRRVEVVFHSAVADDGAAAAGEEETGWDAFSLAYRLDAPLDAIVTRESLERYSRVFSFLWRLKRAQFALDEAWLDHVSAVRTTRKWLTRVASAGVRDVLHRTRVLRAEVAHFVSQLRTYVMFEVLETSWDAFSRRVRGAVSVEDVARAHDEFLRSVVARVTMEVEAVGRKPLGKIATTEEETPETARALAVRLELLLDVALRFCDMHEQMHEQLRADALASAVARRREQDQADDARFGVSASASVRGRGRGRANNDSRGGDDVSVAFGESVDALSSEFWETLTALLSSLRTCASDDLRFLALALDFNDFYRGSAVDVDVDA